MQIYKDIIKFSFAFFRKISAFENTRNFSPRYYLINFEHKKGTFVCLEKSCDQTIKLQQAAVQINGKV